MKSIGIIGSGRWGRNIARSFAKKRNIKRVVSTGNADNIAQMKEVCPDITVSSMGELLDDKNIDAVIVAVPINSLSEVAVKCLVSQKHIFLEKPAASSTLEIKRIEAHAKNLVCFVNYLYLADPSYMSFKHAVSKTNVHSASFSWTKWGSFNNDIMLNLASHDLSMLFDSLPNDTITIVENRISKDDCRLRLNVGNTKVLIDIDRKSKTRNKAVTYRTGNGLYLWTPGFFAHEEMEVSTNADRMLLDVQRDSFLSHINNNTGYNNLELSKKILSFIDEARK